MIKRHTADEATDQSTMGGAKTVIAILIIGAVVLWMAPALLGGETVIAGATAATCPTGDAAPSGIAEEMACARDEVKNSVLILVDIFKYVLLVAAVASVAVLRVGRAAASAYWPVTICPAAPTHRAPFKPLARCPVLNRSEHELGGGPAPDGPQAPAAKRGRPHDGAAMKRTEAADAALAMASGGHTAYICHDGGLRVGDSPSGLVILVIRPGHAVQREPLVALLAHRMRMKGVA